MSLRLGGAYLPNQGYFKALRERFDSEQVSLSILAQDLTEKKNFGDPPKKPRICILIGKNRGLSSPLVSQE